MPTQNTNAYLKTGTGVEVNQKLFGVGDDNMKAKNNGNWDYPQLHDAIVALGVGQSRYPGGAVSNYWDIEKA